MFNDDKIDLIWAHRKQTYPRMLFEIGQVVLTLYFHFVAMNNYPLLKKCVALQLINRESPSSKDALCKIE